jgi:hypothetical protein
MSPGGLQRGPHRCQTGFAGPYRIGTRSASGRQPEPDCRHPPANAEGEQSPPPIPCFSTPGSRRPTVSASDASAIGPRPPSCRPGRSGGRRAYPGAGPGCRTRAPGAAHVLSRSCRRDVHRGTCEAGRDRQWSIRHGDVSVLSNGQSDGCSGPCRPLSKNVVSRGAGFFTPFAHSYRAPKPAGRGDASTGPSPVRGSAAWRCSVTGRRWLPLSGLHPSNRSLT